MLLKILQDKRFKLMLAMFLAVISLIPRVDEFKYYPGKYLWAEDGNVFINQSEELGWSAIFNSYAGYLHLYPRVVAEISAWFELTQRPIVFILGWFLAYLILIHSILRINTINKCGSHIILIVIILVSCQPNYGEVFFNITNSQWLLGAALCLYVLVDDKEKVIAWPMYFAVSIMSITGPFSIFIAPILLIKTYIEGRLKDRAWLCITVSIGALIQFVLLVKSDRVNDEVVNANFSDWIIAFFSLLTFGAKNSISLIAATMIWVWVAYTLYRSFKVNKNDNNVKLAIYIIVSAFIFIVAAMISHKHDPRSIFLIGGGNRYTWIPYTLILTSIGLLVNKNNMAAILIACLFLIIWKENFQRVPDSNLQFQSYVKLAAVEDVIIPIHPMWPSYPGWHIKTNSKFDEVNFEHESIEFNTMNLDVQQIDYKIKNGFLHLKSIGVDPKIIFIDEKVCADNSHVGLIVKIKRSNEGWMQIFWDDAYNFNEANSLRRFYPAGFVIAQFAFPSSKTGMLFRFDPMEHEGEAVIEGIDLYCLD